MRCPNCSTELPDSAKFCLECGRDLRGRSEFASPAAYTPKHLAERILTSRAALEGERKQVTVLFCDIANSTPLAERVGPERMHALLNGFFELALSEVHKLEGTINQFLGDGFMALFGAPLAHEDDARRAVLAAVKIRRALKDRSSYAGLGPGGELMLRMGLNTGLVVVGSIGDNLRMDYTAVGDTTNVAARLPSLMPSRCSRKGARSAGSSSDCSVVRTRSATTSGVSRSSMPHWLRTRSMMGRYGMAAPYERQRTSSVVTSVAPRLRRNS